jgi:hypothetical protein
MFHKNIKMELLFNFVPQVEHLFTLPSSAFSLTLTSNSSSFVLTISSFLQPSKTLTFMSIYLIIKSV